MPRRFSGRAIKGARERIGRGTRTRARGKSNLNLRPDASLRANGRRGVVRRREILRPLRRMRPTRTEEGFLGIALQRRSLHCRSARLRTNLQLPAIAPYPTSWIRRGKRPPGVPNNWRPGSSYVFVEDRPPLGVIANRKLDCERWHLLPPFGLFNPFTPIASMIVQQWPLDHGKESPRQAGTYIHRSMSRRTRTE
jgi:hypothetical protein